jgi:hypothetical protein
VMVKHVYSIYIYHSFMRSYSKEKYGRVLVGSDRLLEKGDSFV